MTALLGIGGLLCCLNFYLSFLRYPIRRMMGGKKEGYRPVSGIPIFGSLFVGLSLFRFWHPPWLLGLAIGLILIDTAGLHWFAGIMLYHHVLKNGNRATTVTTIPSETTPSDGK